MARDSSTAKVRKLAINMPDTLRAHIERRAERMTAKELLDGESAITGTADHWRRVVEWWPDGGAFLFDLLALSERLYSSAGGDGRLPDGAERRERYKGLGRAAKKLDDAVREFQAALGKMPDKRIMLGEAGDSLSVADDAAALEALRALAGGRWRGQLLKALTVLDGTANAGLPVGSLAVLRRVKAPPAVRKTPTRGRYVLRSVVDACCRWELREQQAGRQVGDWPMVALSAILSAAGNDFSVTVKELDDLRRELRKALRDSCPD